MMEAAAAMELEDDLFFKDLSRQISLLITDNDDDIDCSLVHCPSVNLQQAFTQGIYQTAHAASFLNYNHQINKRESKGTGVFIPRSTNPRRKNNTRQGRFTSSGNKFQRLSDLSSRGLPHTAYSKHHHHHIDHSSSNPKRF